MKLLTVLAAAATLFSLQVLAKPADENAAAAVHKEPEVQQEETHHGSFRSVTTTNMWISDDNKNNTWVIDVEGTPVEKYVVDSPERKEISHMETIYHDAVTHEEPVYASRPVWYVSFPYATAVIPTETYYDYNEALSAAGARDGNIEEGSEEYISSYTTVVDRAAYSETVKVIDQTARKEQGHYETEIVGEIGHWEQGKKDKIGKGDGKYQSKMTRGGGEEKTAEEKK